MEVEVIDLVSENERIDGVRATMPQAELEVRADLVVRADGRSFDGARKRAGVERGERGGGEPFTEPLRLGPAFVGERHVDRAGKAIFSAQYCRAVPHHEHSRYHRLHICGSSSRKFGENAILPMGCRSCAQIDLSARFRAASA